jgi:DNA polymerase
MRWSILTPYLAAHWDMQQLTLDYNPDRSAYPDVDSVEKYWLAYYANIFNPARPKQGAMLSQMPKKYWKNMPETVLIPDLLKNSESRAKEMINKQK